MGFPLEHPGCVPGEFALWKGFVVATEWLSPEISRGHGLLGSTWLWPSQVWPLISLFVCLKSTFHWMSRSESRRIRSFFWHDFHWFSIFFYHFLSNIPFFLVSLEAMEIHGIAQLKWVFGGFLNFRRIPNGPWVQYQNMFKFGWFLGYSMIFHDIPILYPTSMYILY